MLNYKPKIIHKFVNPLAKKKGLNYKTKGAGAVDLFTMEDVHINAKHGTIVGVGVAFAIEQDWAGILLPRSGAGNYLKQSDVSIELANTIGLIDSDYRKEVLMNLKLKPHVHNMYGSLHIPAGTRICQMGFVYMPQANLEEWGEDTELPKTERGSGCCNSTGMN